MEGEIRKYKEDAEAYLRNMDEGRRQLVHFKEGLEKERENALRPTRRR